MAVYSEGFLDTLVSIHFPGGGYITVDVSAMNEIVGTTPPFCPTVSLVLPATAKLIDQRETCTKTVVPARTVFTRFRFIWPSGLALPTPANYLNSLAGHQDFVYAQEFSNWIHIQGGGGGFPLALPQPYSTGFYPDNTSAALAAAAWNDAYGAAHAPLGYLYLPPDGGPEAGPITLGSMAAAFLDVPTIIPAFSQSRLSRQYLVQTPRTPVEATLTVLSTLGKDGLVEVKGYVGATPKTMSRVDPNGYTSSQDAVIDPSGHSTFTIDAEITGPINEVSITRGGGGGDA